MVWGYRFDENGVARRPSGGAVGEAIRDRARIIQEEAAAKSSAHMNRQLQTLSVPTALFKPATLVTGLFGMNTHGLPLDGTNSGFWWATVVAGSGSDSGAVHLVPKRIGIVK